jgi:VanZ family protein
MTRAWASALLVRWLPALAWMAVIFLLSSQSGLRVSDDASIDRPIRTAAHMATFTLLGGLILLALLGRGRPTLPRVLLALGLTILYAASDELHQSHVPDRTGRAEDVVIDALGALLGVSATVWLLGRRARAGTSVDGS